MTTRRMLLGSAVSAASLIAVAACSSGSDERPSGLRSSGKLSPDSSVRGAWIYKSPQANYAKYRRVMIDNAAVYTGTEANFGDASDADKQNWANAVTEEMRKVIGEKYPLVAGPGPDVLRISTTLIGVRQTVGGVATVTRVMPIGIAINAVRGAAGAGGTMTGGIEIAVELHDSQSGELLAGAVREISPAAFDVGATLSTTDTVKASARDAATTLRDAMDRNMTNLAKVP